MKLIDISMTLNNHTPAWPGDEEFHYTLQVPMSGESPMNVGRFKSSNHTGTHIDAPFHYQKDGLKVADLPLERFTGSALVVNMVGKEIITAEDLKPFDFADATKVLFRTNSWENREQFPSAYTVIGEDVAPFLADYGIELIGVDTPSVDAESNEGITAHLSLSRHDIFIMEGLVLDHVAPGLYELMAFPLKMEEADGSPVRAVLIDPVGS